MKINYKNTALGLIDDPKNFTFGFAPDITPNLTKGELLAFGKSIQMGGSTLKRLCGSNINYVSHSFLNAYIKAIPKLKGIFDREIINDSGVLIIKGNEAPISFTHTIYYTVCSIVNSDGTIGYNILYMDFSIHSKTDSHALDVYFSVETHKDSYKVNTKSLIWDGHLRQGKPVEYWEAFIIGFCLFKKYCDIETKVIDPKKNRRLVVAGEKHLNETDKKINVLDCTWFTNLVVSGAFEVDGHLHWYWTGPGRTIKKLQWVSTYEKKGYTRKAKVLMHNSNSQNEVEIAATTGNLLGEGTETQEEKVGAESVVQEGSLHTQ